MTELTRRALAQGTTKLIWDVGSRSLGFLLTIVLARNLGATGFGEFAVYWYTALLLAQLSDLGLHLATLRELSRGETPRAFGSAVAIKSVVSLGVLALAALASPSPLVAALLVSQLLGSWVELFGAALRSRGLLAREGLLIFFLRASWIVAAGWSLGRGADLGVVAIALAVASGLAALMAAIVCSRSFSSWRLWGGATLAEVKSLLRESLPLATTSVITLLYLRADLFIVSAFHGPYETGVFQSAFRLFEACFVLSGGLAAGTFPLIAARFGTREFEPLARFLLGWACVIALPLVLGFGLFATPLISTIYGDAFAPAAKPLPFFGLALFAVFVNSVSTHALVAAGRARRLVGAMLVRLGVGLALDLALVPRYGALGAAGAVAIAEWSLTFVSLTMLANLVRPKSSTAPGVASEELSSCS